MKKTLKLIPAIAMLLISAIMLSTATFAWFSMNNRVTVTGMTLKTQVSSNLLISPDTTEGNFTTTLEQARTAKLEPTSTADGASFWYTTSAYANGAKATGDWAEYDEATALTDADTFAAKTNYDADFNAAYAITGAPPGTAAAYANAYGYVDYDFYLKATSTEAGQKVAMTFCNILYNGGEITDKAWRVAVFAKGAADAASTSGAQTLIAILSPSGATYQDSTNAVTGATTRGAVSNLGTAVTLDTIGAGTVKYYHVTLRVWLEGEDTTCTNSTYASLTNAYTVAVDFVLSTFDGVQNISSASGQASATAAGLTATATLNTSETVGATYQWYDSGDNAIGGATSVSYTAGEAASGVYCKITTTSGQVYRSNDVNLGVAP